MIISQEDKAILYNTYLKVARSDANLTEIFYTRLFETNPSFKAFFPTDMRRQGIKFRMMLNTIVIGMDNLTVLKYRLRELGKHHSSFRLSTHDYRNFIEAFLWTLKTQLGSEFTFQIEDTWRRTLALVMDYMIEGSG